MSYDFQTSKPAYEEAKKNISIKQQLVFNVIKNLVVCTDAQIAEELKR